MTLQNRNSGDQPSAFIEAIATRVHSNRCRMEGCTLPYGAEDLRAAQSALAVIAEAFDEAARVM